LKCEFCNKEFKQATRFERHICEKKRRFLNKDTRTGQLAFEMFNKFNRHHHIKPKEPFKKFLTSKHYRAFETLAKFFMQVKPLDSNGYFDYLIKSNAPFRKWTSEDFYQAWVQERILTEPAPDAVERSIDTLQEYAQENQIQLEEVIDKLSGNRLALWLQTGRLSPWYVILSPHTRKILDKLDMEMLQSLDKILNPLYWRLRVQKDPRTTEIKQGLLELNL